MLYVPKAPERQGPSVVALLKTQARVALRHAIARYAQAIEKTPGKLTLRDTRSRWGSCNTQGDLMFSWRLAMAPPDVLNYVAAHEVAHLAHMDHSPRFWDCVAQIYPEYQTQKAWLRAHGPSLLAWSFETSADAGAC